MTQLKNDLSKNDSSKNSIVASQSNARFQMAIPSMVPTQDEIVGFHSKLKDRDQSKKPSAIRDRFSLSLEVCCFIFLLLGGGYLLNQNYELSNQLDSYRDEVQSVEVAFSDLKLDLKDRKADANAVLSNTIKERLTAQERQIMDLKSLYQELTVQNQQLNKALQVSLENSRKHETMAVTVKEQKDQLLGMRTDFEKSHQQLQSDVSLLQKTVGSLEDQLALLDTQSNHLGKTLYELNVALEALGSEKEQWREEMIDIANVRARHQLWATLQKVKALEDSLASVNLFRGQTNKSLELLTQEVRHLKTKVIQSSE